MVEKNGGTDTIKSLEVESLIDAHLFYTGQVTGQLYEWVRAGSIVGVDEQDVPELLAKRLGAKLCCGGNDNRIFQVVSSS